MREEPPHLSMDYWHGRQAQLTRDGGTEFVLTPFEWFALKRDFSVQASVEPLLLFGKPVRVAWESAIPCPHCGLLPSDLPTTGEIIPRR